jgi:hypothetical protein
MTNEKRRERARKRRHNLFADPNWRARRYRKMRARRRKQRADPKWFAKYRAGVRKRRKLRSKPGYRKRAYRHWS